MQMQRKLISLAIGVAIAGVSGLSAGAAEVKITSSNALKASLEQLAPAFEQASGHTVAFTWGAGAVLKAAIESGANSGFDAVILASPAIDDLIRKGRVAETGRTVLAYSNAGVAVRKGAAKPDISTVDGFKRALLDAKSIALVEQGGTGIYMRALLPRLGIADAVRDKIRFLPPEIPAAKAVADGQAELGITQVSEILPYAGAELVGPLPKEIAMTDAFVIAIGAGAGQAGPARMLIDFLTAPAAATVYRAKGLDPAR